MTNARRSAPAPVSAHPAFPAIVALWFAALLGFGSLILPLVLLERLSSATGLAALVPAMAPPLGFSARAIFALAASISGAALGLVLARQVARAQAPRPTRRFVGEARPCKPISAHEELGEEGLGTGAPPPASHKRRALAVAEEGGRSDFLQTAPLPGQDFRAPAPSPLDPSDPLELCDFADPDGSGEGHSDQDFDMTDDADQPGFEPQEFAEDTRQEFNPSPAREPRAPQAFDPLPEYGDDAGDGDTEEIEADEDNLADAAEALPFAAPSLRRAPAAASPAPAADEPADEPAEPEEPHPAAAQPTRAPSLGLVEASGVEAGAGGDPDEGALEQLGLVQLATRLGKAIERRRELRGRAAPAPAPRYAPIFSPTADDLDAAAAEDAAAARASFFADGAAPGGEGDERDGADETALPAAAPAAASAAPRFEAEHDADHDEDDDADFAASLSLPLRGLSTSAPNLGSESLDEEEEDGEALAGEDDYSSLLAMKNPFQKKADFVRIDEPEPDEEDVEATVTFPGAVPPATDSRRAFDPPAGAQPSEAPVPRRDQDEAARELRAALETLQRMSGTG